MIPSGTGVAKPNRWSAIQDRLKGRRWADIMSDDDSSVSFAQSRSKTIVGDKQGNSRGGVGSGLWRKFDLEGSRGINSWLKRKPAPLRRYPQPEPAGADQPATENNSVSEVQDSNQEKDAANRACGGNVIPPSSSWSSVRHNHHLPPLPKAAAQSKTVFDKRGSAAKTTEVPVQPELPPRKPQQRFSRGFSDILTEINHPPAASTLSTSPSSRTLGGKLLSQKPSAELNRFRSPFESPPPAAERRSPLDHSTSIQNRDFKASASLQPASKSENRVARGAVADEADWRQASGVTEQNANPKPHRRRRLIPSPLLDASSSLSSVSRTSSSLNASTSSDSSSGPPHVVAPTSPQLTQTTGAHHPATPRNTFPKVTIPASPLPPVLLCDEVFSVASAPTVVVSKVVDGKATASTDLTTTTLEIVDKAVAPIAAAVHNKDCTNPPPLGAAARFPSPIPAVFTDQGCAVPPPSSTQTGVNNGMQQNQIAPYNGVVDSSWQCYVSPDGQSEHAQWERRQLDTCCPMPMYHQPDPSVHPNFTNAPPIVYHHRTLCSHNGQQHCCLGEHKPTMQCPPYQWAGGASAPPTILHQSVTDGMMGFAEGPNGSSCMVGYHWMQPPLSVPCHCCAHSCYAGSYMPYNSMAHTPHQTPFGQFWPTGMQTCALPADEAPIFVEDPVPRVASAEIVVAFAGSTAAPSPATLQKFRFGSSAISSEHSHFEAPNCPSSVYVSASAVPENPPTDGNSASQNRFPRKAVDGTAFSNQSTNTPATILIHNESKDTPPRSALPPRPQDNIGKNRNRSRGSSGSKSRRAKPHRSGAKNNQKPSNDLPLGGASASGGHPGFTSDSQKAGSLKGDTRRQVLAEVDWTVPDEIEASNQNLTGTHPPPRPQTPFKRAPHVSGEKLQRAEFGGAKSKAQIWSSKKEKKSRPEEQIGCSSSSQVARCKQVARVKTSAAYSSYVSKVPKNQRKLQDPNTPPATALCSLREFNDRLMVWKTGLSVLATGDSSSIAAESGSATANLAVQTPFGVKSFVSEARSSENANPNAPTTHSPLQLKPVPSARFCADQKTPLKSSAASVANQKSEDFTLSGAILLAFAKEVGVL